MKAILKYSLAIAMVLVDMAVYGQLPLSLWYKSPARTWEACVPLGNGRLGITPNGDVAHENIVLNDITLWSGSKQNADMAGAAQKLPEIQSLILSGKYIEAQQIMSKYFKSAGKGSGEGKGADVPYGSYQMLGNLNLHFFQQNLEQVKDYKRQLFIDSAIAYTTYNLNGIGYKREYLTSFNSDVIIIRLTASANHHINFRLGISRPERAVSKIIDKDITFAGQLNSGTDKKGMEFLTRVKILQTGGSLDTYGDSLQVKNANTATIYISSATDYKNAGFSQQTEKKLAVALQTPFAVERQKHIDRFQRLFKTAGLKIEGADRSYLPTDERLYQFQKDTSDTGLPALYFQYGRYLLISSTRPGLLPPNLQGLWANTLQTPWNGDYHLDINIQMNHWPLDVTGLGELNGPFYDLVQSLVRPGMKTARVYYNSPGWVAHVITNIWGYTSPGEDYSWGAFNTGSAWLCQMLYSHYEFSNDDNYLKKIYPILKESAIFYLHALVKDKTTGWLVTVPSNSPENEFILPDGRHASVTAGPTIDNQLIRFLFKATHDAASKLKTDKAFSNQLMKAYGRLPPNQIGNNGKLKEWLADYRATDIKHRHVSPLWGLYPGQEINSTTPTVTNAARNLLEERGDDGTGWSLAWKINLWARLHEGDHAFRLLHRLLKPVVDTGFNMSNGGGSYINLFCAHPPFQIDGNFGGTAGIAEMLVQSSSGYIELLPALPRLWQNGSFYGLRVRGGGSVDLKWADGKVKMVKLKAFTAGRFKVKVTVNTTSVAGMIGKQLKKIPVKDGFINVRLHKGQTFVFKFI